MSSTPIQDNKFLSNARNDKWWVGPLLVLFGLLSFVVYSTWAAWQGEYFWWSDGHKGFGGYLSPFYSPPFFIDSSANGVPAISHALFGEWPVWLREIWPKWLPTSPAWLILIFPLSFRFTCYYYRKAYYRAFTWTPPACAVTGLSQKDYKGETKWLLFQNIHRITMYFAIIFIFILSYDAFMSFFQNGKFGIGVGSVILLINPILLGSYTFGCHAFRHIIGGNMDCYSCSLRGNIAHKSWSIVSVLNKRHQLFAWLSLIWVGLTDIYVRLVSSGVIIDINTW